MAHPILDGIRIVRRRLVRRTWEAGALRVLASAVAVVCLLGAVDFVVGVSDPGVRLMMTLVAIGAVGVAIWRWIARPLSSIPRDVLLARRIIEQDRRLGEELPSAVEFLRQSEDDAWAGSDTLRRAVVIQAALKAEDVAWRQTADRLPGDRLRRAAAIALFPIVLLTAIAIWRPGLVAVGVARLAAPWSAVDWPRENDLHFVGAPERIASGQSFEVELADRHGRLPGAVWIQYRYLRDGQEVVQREPMQRYGDVMVARRETVTQPFAYRAFGGDDDRMPWKQLEIVEPPRVRSLELMLYPPAYSGLEVHSSDRHVRALPGTQIEMTAEVSHSVVRAEVVNENGNAVAATVSANGRTVHIPPGSWAAMETASWTLKLEDAEGLVGGQDDRISVHVSPDPPPSVVLERPPIDQYVTPEASVSFSVAVKDNLAVREITLAFLRSDQSDQDRQRIELYRGPAEPPRITAESLAAIESDRRHVDYVWELAPLGLAPGTFLAIHAEASDYQGQLGQTLLPRNIHIVSVADLEARLAEQQDILLGELERALQLERDARRDVGGVQVQLAEVGTLAQREVDVLQAVEINQRHIAELLADRAEGIPGRIAALRGDLAANRIESPDIHRRLDELDAALGNLATEHLSVIQHELTSALKTVGSSDVDKERLGQTIASAAEHQDAVIESLAALLGDFSRWSDYRRFARDISQLRADQQQIAQTVREEIGLDQLHVESSELTAQQRADREKVVERQLELARRLESLQQQMDRTVAELTAADPLAATTLADALDAARRNAVDRHMREGADHVGRNQIGRSLDALAHVDEALREVLDILRDTRGGELRRLVSKLRAAEEDLRALEEQAAGIVSKMDAAQGQESPDNAGRELQRLLREQQELRQEVQQMSRRLLRLTADLAARSAARAAEQLAPGGQSGAGAAEDAGRERVRAAEQDLEQAQAELAAAREQAEADLVAEQLADMQTALSSLATRQERVVDETARLDAARQSSGEWSLGQLQSLASAAKEEELLHEETAAAAEAMLELGVVRTALAMAAREMATAATGLAGRNTGPDTQRAGRAALVRLRMVLEALGDQPAPDADSQATDAAGASGEGGESQAGEEPNAIDVAELRLLKLMQLDLRERTAAAEAALAASGEQRPKAEAEYAELAVEQGQMATLVSQLLDQAAEGQNNEDAILPSLEDALEQDEALPDIDF